MRTRLMILALAAVAALSFPHASFGQAPAAAVPATTSPKPAPGPAPVRDLSGIWSAAGISPIGFSNKHPKFTALGETRFRANKPGRGITETDIAYTNDPLDSCDPEGFPRNEIFEFRAVQIVPTPGRMLMMYQYQRVWRNIFTDGRDFPKDLDYSLYGYSIGKWVDDYTFVIETKGLDDHTWIDNSGLPHSLDLRVEERFHRVSHDTIEFSLTIDDPKIYTERWTPVDKLKLTLDPTLEIPEMFCVPTEMEQYKKLIANPTASGNPK
jgi:hypothetical protein